MSVLNVAAAVFQPVGLGNQLCNHSMYDFFLCQLKFVKIMQLTFSMASCHSDF